MNQASANLKAATEFAQLDTVALQDLFGNRLPVSVKSLVFNLEKLEESPDDPHFQTIGIVFSALIRDLNNRQRKLFFNYVVQEVEARKMGTAALLAFIRFESDQHVVCHAVWSYLLNRRAPLDQPLIAVTEILNIVDNEHLRNRGGVYAGLICFGDRKVAAASRSLRGLITAMDAKDFAAAITAPLHRATMDFCLGWLLDSIREDDIEIAMQVAYAISGMVIKDSEHLIHDRDHHFGPYAFKAATNLPQITLEDWLLENSDILDSLEMVKKPAIEQLLAILKNPEESTMEQLERRKESGRRKVPERRASDRRIVNITPLLERRSRERRNDERRSLERRT